MKCLAVANQKGGVGKTSTAVNLAAILGEQGERVLLIDLDAQGNATRWLGLERSRDILDVLGADKQLSDIIIPTTVTGVSCVPAAEGLATLDRALAGEVGIETLLRDQIVALPPDWDWVIIDAPPALGLVTINLLTAADDVVIPCEAKVMPVEGLIDILRSVEKVKARLNPRLSVLGIVPCRTNSTNLTKAIISGLRKKYGALVTTAQIRESTRLAEAPGHRQPLTVYAPSEKATADYRELAAELISRSAASIVTSGVANG